MLNVFKIVGFPPTVPAQRLVYSIYLGLKGSNYILHGYMEPLGAFF